MIENALIKNCTEIFCGFADDVAPDVLEAGIDQLFEDGLLRDIPVVGSIYKAGQAVAKVVSAFQMKHILVFATIPL